MSVFDEIKERLNIVEFIGATVPLRKSGRSYLGFCPFHQNTRTPAFTVFPETQSFHCFGCQASGSIFDFVMLQQGISFPEALELLARQAGVTLRERTPAEQEHDEHRKRLLAINAAAAFYFNYILLKHRWGQPGREYLEQRAIDLAAVEVFQPGYSLNEWGHLLAYLSEKKGFAIADIAATGLIVQRESGGWFDRFRGRLMFPIQNEKGEIVGFGGRIISPPSDTASPPPKYLNTPQTALFDKGHLLYGLHQARDAIRKADTAIVVEGYLDVLTAHQHGFTNVVAPLGTAITADHVSLLKKRSRNVMLALDADAAGQKATIRSIHAFQDSPGSGNGADTAANGEAGHMVGTAHGLVRWESDITLRIIRMPPGQDPDEVIRNNPQGWRDLVAAAVPVVDFFFETSLADLDLTNPHDQGIALERLLPVLAELEAIPQRVYTARLEQLIGVENIRDLIRARKPETAPQVPVKRGRSDSPPLYPFDPPPPDQDYAPYEFQHPPHDPYALPDHAYHSDHSDYSDHANHLDNPVQAQAKTQAKTNGGLSGPGATPSRSLVQADHYLVLRGYRAPPSLPQEDHLLALLLRYPATIRTVEEIIAEDVDPFPAMYEVLGNTIAHLFEQTENRLIWQYWVEAGFPAVPRFYEEMSEHDEDATYAVYTEESWITRMPEPLRSQFMHLISMNLPRPTEYKYLQEVCACMRILRIRQVKQWYRRLSQRIRESRESEAELPRLVGLLATSTRYLAALSTPPQGRWHDLRSTLEKER